MTNECIYCGEELWSARERSGVCCSCQGLHLDGVGDDEADDDDDDDYCASCGGPCTGLGDFLEDDPCSDSPEGK